MSAIPEWEVWLDEGPGRVCLMYRGLTLAEAESERERWQTRWPADEGCEFFVVRGER